MIRNVATIESSLEIYNKIDINYIEGNEFGCD